MRKVAMGVLGALLIGIGLPLLAQEDGAGPAPNIIQIGREMVKPGRGAAHEKVEAGWPKAYKASKNSAHYLAMTAMTGPNEAWFISGYDSYEAMEKQNKAEASDPVLSAELTRLQIADGEFLESTRTITAHYRPDLSMRPSINMGSYRYINVVTTRVRPGTQTKFVEMRKAIKAAHEKAGMKDYYSVFEVQSGMTGPVYLIFIPMKSLKEADEAGPLHDSAAYKEALGGDDGQKKMAELASTAIVSNESAIFSFSPKMSVVPPAFLAGGNADYWNPKPMMAATPKAKTTASVKKP
jgi:hypothetical protein